MLQANIGPTFSDVWYRVGPLRTRLSPHAQVIRQKFGRQTAYIIEDPASGQYYRFTESAYLFLAMLDGRCTVDEAWNSCAQRLGDEAPTQRECIELLARLQYFGLLVGEQPLAADMVEFRLDEARRTRREARTGKWFFFSIPLLNPDRFLDSIAHLLRPVFSRWGLAAWVVLILVALWHLGTNLRAFSDEFVGVLDPANLVWLSVLFLILRSVHEFGHAAACKALGGRCTEIGLLLIGVVLPLPYCDATSAWRFPEVWRRVVVSAGGVMAESVLAAIAAVVWARTETGTLAHLLAHNTVLVSGIATLVFNLNPLLRYDGYYILSDIAGVPNLAMRSRDVLKYLMERYAFGLRGLTPPQVRGPAELGGLILFGLLSTPYRLLVTALILWALLTTVPWIGVPLAIIGGVIVVVLPLAKGTSYLLTSPQLMGRRARALAIVGTLLLALVVGLAIVPAPASVNAIATLEPARRGPVRAGEEGLVVAAHAAPGQLVHAGQVVLTLESPALTKEIEEALAQREGAAAALDDAMDRRNDTQAEVSRQRVAYLDAVLTRLRERQRELDVRAPIDGRLQTSRDVGASLDNLVGRTLARGTLVAVVISDDLVVQASVSDRDFAYAFRGSGAPNPAADPDAAPSAADSGSTDDAPHAPVPPDLHATFRIRGLAGQELSATIVRVDAAASRALASPSLAATVGGDILLDPSDPEHRRALESQFLVELRPQRLPEGVLAGLRARVRFDAGSEPLLAQWWRLIRQRVTDRMGV